VLVFRHSIALVTAGGEQLVRVDLERLKERSSAEGPGQQFEFAGTGLVVSLPCSLPILRVGSGEKSAIILAW